MKNKAKSLLLWSQKYTKTDMLYLAKGGFWLTTAKVASALCSLVSSIVFANYLPEETYGMFRYALSFFVIFSVLTLSGLDTAVVKAVANGFDKTVIVAFFRKMQFGLLAFVAGIAIATYYFINDNSTLGTIFILASVLVPSMESFYIFVAYLNGKKDFLAITTYVSTTRIITTLLLVIAALITNSILIIISIYLLSHLSLRALFFWISLKKYPTSEKIDEQAISFGMHLTLTQGVTQLAGVLDKILIFNFVSGAVLAGYYLALVPYKQVVNILGTIDTLAFPKMALNDAAQLRKKLPKLLLKLYFLVIPVILMYWLVANTVFSIILPKYTDYIFLSQIIMSILLMLYPLTMLQTALTSQSAKKEIYQITFGTAVVRIMLLVLLVPLYGMWGAVFVIILAHIIQSFLSVFTFLKFTSTVASN